MELAGFRPRQLFYAQENSCIKNHMYLGLSLSDSCSIFTLPHSTPPRAAPHLELGEILGSFRAQCSFPNPALLAMRLFVCLFLNFYLTSGLFLKGFRTHGGMRLNAIFLIPQKQKQKQKHR